MGHAAVRRRGAGPAPPPKTELGLHYECMRDRRTVKVDNPGVPRRLQAMLRAAMAVDRPRTSAVASRSLSG